MSGQAKQLALVSGDIDIFSKSQQHEMPQPAVMSQWKLGEANHRLSTRSSTCCNPMTFQMLLKFDEQIKQYIKRTGL